MAMMFGSPMANGIHVIGKVLCVGPSGHLDPALPCKLDAVAWLSVAKITAALVVAAVVNFPWIAETS